MTREEREQRIREVLGRVYEAGADRGRKPGKREQIVDWGLSMLIFLITQREEAIAVLECAAHLHESNCPDLAAGFITGWIAEENWAKQTFAVWRTQQRAAERAAP